MRFDYRQIDDLPRLAWCAQLTKGSKSILVRHGPWVEIRDDCFFEGAWSGPFEQACFDTAHTFAGSGGRLTPDGVLFAAPTHPVERIYSSRVGDNLFVSNSWVFLLVAIDDQPDLNHATYFFDLRHNFRGFNRSPTRLRTQKGNSVDLLDGRNMVVTADLSIRYVGKERPAEPQTYAQLVELLRTTVNLMVVNASHPARKQRYRPVCMTSTGYDSTAASVLAAQAGCTESVTFSRLYREGPAFEDDGSQIALALGLTPTSYARFDYQERTDFPEAEFCTSGPVTWTPISAMEQTLVGSLLFTGVIGYYWQDQSYKIPPYTISDIGDVTFPFTSITEFRLRVGFFAFPALHAGAIHDKALRRITCSDEMRPWVLSDRVYNKPVQRRMLEEAGVPRTFFGQPNRANAFANLSQPKAFSPASLEDFTSFCLKNQVPLTKSNQYHFRVMAHLSRRLARDGSRLLRKVPPPIYFGIMHHTWWLYPDAGHANWRAPELYTFHWGFEHTRHRYRTAGITNGMEPYTS